MLGLSGVSDDGERTPRLLGVAWDIKYVFSDPCRLDYETTVEEGIYIVRIRFDS